MPQDTPAANMRSAGYVLVGALPPPVHGMALVNAAVCGRLASVGLLVGLHDIGPGTARLRLVHHARRAARVLRAAASIAVKSGPKRGLYMGADGGPGLHYFALLARIAVWRRAPIVIHHHSYAYVMDEARAMRRLIRAAGPRQRHVFLCVDMRDRFCARYARDLPPRMESHILSNAFMIPPESAAPAERNGAHLVIGHLSNLSREKGTEIFVRLALDLIDQGVIAGAELAGPVADPHLRAEIEAATARTMGKLRHRGAVEGAAKTRFFADIDVFVFPTLYRNEAQPLVLFEALAHGRPIVAAARGCIACDHAASESLVVEPDTDFIQAASAWLRELGGRPGALQDRQAAAAERGTLTHQTALKTAEAFFKHTLLQDLSSAS